MKLNLPHEQHLLNKMQRPSDKGSDREQKTQFLAFSHLN